MNNCQKIVRALLCAANGSEEIETVNIVNTLVRGGINVIIAKVFENDEKSSDLVIKCARGMRLIADKPFDECKDDNWDVIVLPGGKLGAENLSGSDSLIKLLHRQRNSKKLYAAICASPAIVFQPHGLLDGEMATCYPIFKENLKENHVNQRVVISNNCVTSQGPGTAIELGLTLLELLVSKEKSEEVGKALLINNYL